MKGKKFKDLEFIEESCTSNHRRMICPEDKGVISYSVYMNLVGYHTCNNFTKTEIVNAIEEDMINCGYVPAV